jgi:Holliday junction resolvase RusA-like endonuclease
MQYKINFTIPGELPGLNEIIEAAKRCRYTYADMKEIFTTQICWIVKGKPKTKNPVIVKITWFAKSMRRDPDNVMAGQKFIMDALVKMGIIHNDTWMYVKEIKHHFAVSRKNPRVQVEIEESF